MLTLVTYIYPHAVQFIPYFLASVTHQTLKEFDLLIFNDGVDKTDLLFEKYSGSYKIVDLSGTVAQIRFSSFEYLKNCNADYFVFQDIDDTMTENRLEVSKTLLEKYSLVCNDLNIIDSEELVNKRSLWEKRLGRLFEFDHNFLFDKNILGFTNTAIRKSLLNTTLSVGTDITAVDWFVFFQLLFESGEKAAFTAECQSNYRQHAQNIAGLGHVTNTKISYTLKVKKQHYTALQNAGFDVTVYLSEIKELEIKSKNFFTNNSHQSSDLFWWEETKYLYEEN